MFCKYLQSILLKYDKSAILQCFLKFFSKTLFIFQKIFISTKIQYPTFTPFKLSNEIQHPLCFAKFWNSKYHFSKFSGIFKTSLLVTSKIYSIQNFCSNFIMLLKQVKFFNFSYCFILSFLSLFSEKALYVFICWNVTSILF